MSKQSYETVAEAIRAWKIAKAKMQLDSLESNRTDEEIDRIVGAAQAAMLDIERDLAQSSPETLSDLAGLLDIAIDIVSEGGSTDEREQRVLRLVRENLMSVDDWGRSRKVFPSKSGEFVAGRAA